MEWIQRTRAPRPKSAADDAIKEHFLAVVTLGAIGEYVNDKLSNTSRRNAAPSLIARGILGGLSGACLCAGANQSLLVGVLLGAIGAVIGTFGGYQARLRLVRALHVKDIFVAMPEDPVALGAAYVLVSAR